MVNEYAKLQLREASLCEALPACVPPWWVQPRQLLCCCLRWKGLRGTWRDSGYKPALSGACTLPGLAFNQAHILISREKLGIFPA